MSTSWATAARTVPGLEHDPCPGDPPSTRRLAADLRSRADLVAAAATTCHGWQPVRWQGDASRAARLEAGAVGDALAPLRRSFDAAAEALEAWAAELGALQDEADALGRESLEMRRRHDAETVALAGAPTTATVPRAGPPLGQERLLSAEHRVEREALQRRVEALHARWAARSRACSADLDRAAPPGGGVWRGAWDQASDAYQLQVRSSARMIGWYASATGTVSTVTGAVALVPTPATPVLAGVSIATGTASALAHGLLWTGADGSGTDAALAAGGAVAGVATRVAAVAADAGPTVARVGVTLVDGSASLASVAGELWGLVTGRGDGEAPGEVAGLDGAPLPVTVHDVDSPWHVGDGGLRGAGFAGVAVVPVPTPAPAPSARPAAARTTTSPTPTSAPPTGPPAPRPAGTPTPAPGHSPAAPSPTAPPAAGPTTAGATGPTPAPTGRHRRPVPADG